MHARATIGFGFTSDWLKKWREDFEPITNSLITFDTQLKTALSADITGIVHAIRNSRWMFGKRDPNLVISESDHFGG